MTTTERSAVGVPAGLREPLEAEPDDLSHDRFRRLRIHGAQLLLLACILAAWQWLPSIGPLARSNHIFDRFFISSPQRIVTQLYHLLAGDATYGQFPVYTFTLHTITATILGMLIGMTAGAIVGLILGSSKTMSDIFRPFVVAMNAIPRITLIPIVMILFGPTFKASTVVAVMVTFFIAFFNSYEGARTVSPQLIQNAKLLGASRTAVMLRIRLPFAAAWTIAALPLAVTFAITTVVVGEMLLGSPGLGRELGIATAQANATFVFELALILTVVALVLVGIAELFTKRILHWWGK